jgi:hypothetical protein
VILLIVFILIPIIIAGVLFFWVSSFSSSEDYMNESFVGALKQGDGNMTSGCLFEIYKLSGEPIRINNYRFKVSGVTGQPITLQWPDDGNTTAYTIDSGMGGSDSDCWNPVETIGFDAPPGLTGIEDGDKIEVLVLNREYGEVVFSDSFIYQD